MDASSRTTSPAASRTPATAPLPPRIEPQSLPLPPDVAQRMTRLIPAGMPPPQIFLTMARNAGLFNHLVDTGWLGPTGLLDRRVIPPALREAVILRTCHAAGNAYEWNLHVQTVSRRMGLSAAQIEDLRSDTPDPALWSPGEVAVLALVDALVRRLDVDDAVYAPAAAHFDAATLLELTLLTGLYTSVAMLTALARPAWDRYR